MVYHNHNALESTSRRLPGKIAMNVKQLGLKMAVGTLLVVVLSSYAFYWLGMSQMHENVLQLVEFTRHLESADNFHSSIHSMLLEAEGYYQSRGASAYREAYKDSRAVAQVALDDLWLQAGLLPTGRRKKDISLRTRGITDAFAQYQKDLDRIMSGDFTDGEQRLARAASEFNNIFKKYYLRLHDHHNDEQVVMSRKATRTWHTMSLVFGVQLVIALVAGLLVVLYLDRVVLKLFNFTERMAYRDKLTGLRNRSALQRVIDSLDGPQGRPRRRYGLIMLDIDHFKNFNDTYGHPAGDVLLRDFAKVIIDNVRGQDRVVRYGGEEFLVVLQGVNRNEASAVAEKLRAAIEEHRFPLPDGSPASRITASLGVALYPQDGDDYQQVVNRADERLYQAKEQGRNRVVGPPASEEGPS